MGRIAERIIEVILILGVIYLLAGCQSVNGLSKDIRGLAHYVDTQIVDE